MIMNGNLTYAKWNNITYIKYNYQSIKKEKQFSFVSAKWQMQQHLMILKKFAKITQKQSNASHMIPEYINMSLYNNSFNIMRFTIHNTIKHFYKSKMMELDRTLINKSLYQQNTLPKQNYRQYLRYLHEIINAVSLITQNHVNQVQQKCPISIINLFGTRLIFDILLATIVLKILYVIIKI
ncbi:hypothetical protein pb186bvf_021033 [Paramecium bursaria]